MKDKYPFYEVNPVVDEDILELYETFSDEHLQDIWSSSLVNADYHLLKARICENILDRRGKCYGRNLRTDDDESERC